MQHDFILLDRSGSMSSLWGEALSAVNAYVKKLADDKVDTGVTLAVFDGQGGLEFNVIRDRIIPSTWMPVSSADAVPRGMTPLSDAVGRVVALANAGNYDKVAIIIMTDGHENASQELTVAQAKKLLDDCRAKNWQVMFLGADFDNTSQAAAYGNVVGSTVSIAPQNLTTGFMAMAATRTAYGATGAAMVFSDEEKQKLAERKPSV